MALDLAPYAVCEKNSRGRRHGEPPPQGRGEFQRDRDRILHSSAFRRLEYKTQVFINHEGDWFRTRLTHTLEVSQISRSVARSLRLNEDLAEAIALAHDLGHTPFGHAGQDALNEVMAPWGGFEHNIQSLRVVDVLENKYLAFDGLNLTFETREGILKHCNPKAASKLGDVGERFLRSQAPSLEAQLTNVCDEIAYLNHDLDDGLRSGLLSPDELFQIPLVGEHWQALLQRHPQAPLARLQPELIRSMINALVTDLTQNSQRRLEASRIASLEDVRQGPPLAGFSPEMEKKAMMLKSYLFSHLYHAPSVLVMVKKAKMVLSGIFFALQQEPRLLPLPWRERFDQDGARTIADFVAGLTDRGAMALHRRLFFIEETFPWVTSGF